MASTENGTMTLTEARQIASQAVMRLGSYDPASASDRYRLDSAIKAAGDEFTMRLFPVRKMWTFQLPANSRFVSYKDATAAPAWVNGNSYNIGDLVQVGSIGYEAFTYQSASTVSPANDPQNWGTVIVPPSDYSCRRVRWSEMIDNTNGRRLMMQMVDPETVKSCIWRPFGFVYTPNLIIPSAAGSAFGMTYLTAYDQENNQQWFYPIFTQVMSVSSHYWIPFTSWTLGTDTPDTVILNIPDTMIRGILYYLVPQFFDLAQASNDYIKTCQAKMKEHYAFSTRAIKGSSVQLGLTNAYGAGQVYGVM